MVRSPPTLNAMKKTICATLSLACLAFNVAAQPAPRVDAAPNNPMGAMATPQDSAKPQTPRPVQGNLSQSPNLANVNGLMISNTSIAPTIAPANTSSLYSGFSKDVLTSPPAHSAYFQNPVTCLQVGITRTCN